MTYGIVFRAHDKLFLSEYDQNGNIQDGDTINDPKNTYANLKDNQLSVVEIHHLQQDIPYLKDLKTITVLQNGDGPTLAKIAYNAIQPR